MKYTVRGFGGGSLAPAVLHPACLADEGFGVGHTRVTQTKGVWMWGEPVPVTSGGRTVNVSIYRVQSYLA